MKKRFGKTDAELAHLWAELFELASLAGIPSEEFTLRFFQSEYPEGMSSGDFLVLGTPIGEIVRELGKDVLGKGEVYHPDVMHWIGYTYLSLIRVGELYPFDAYYSYPPSSLKDIYLPFHTYSAYSSLERILEGDGIDRRDINEDAKDVLRSLRLQKPQLTN